MAERINVNDWTYTWNKCSSRFHKHTLSNLIWMLCKIILYLSSLTHCLYNVKEELDSCPKQCKHPKIAYKYPKNGMQNVKKATGQQKCRPRKPQQKCSNTLHWPKQSMFTMILVNSKRKQLLPSYTTKTSYSPWIYVDITFKCSEKLLKFYVEVFLSGKGDAEK